jgi:hypothetical protein
MHNIVAQSAFKNRDVACLKMQDLRGIVGSNIYQPIFRALVNNRDILRLRNCSECAGSYGYVPGPKYNNARLRKFYVTDPRLIDRLHKFRLKEAGRTEEAVSA